MNILIPMAGEGSRFKINGYELPKPLIEVDGKPMIKRAIETLGIEGHYIFVVRKYNDEKNNEHIRTTLKEIVPKCDIIEIGELTNGSAETCLKAKELINNKDELIITNCDQLMEWDSTLFMNFIKNDMDGAVVTYKSTDPKNSFVELNDDGFAKRMVEKDPISDIALIGLHYWKHGSDFISSVDKMIKDDVRHKGEYYVAPTYNFLITEGKKISVFHLSSNQYIPVGTPEDLNIYIGRKKEYNKDKLKTIICDLDGTILKHIHRYSKINEVPTLLKGVRKKIDEWDSIGHKIILMTGRKESAREVTVNILKNLAIPYDLLIMGVGNGNRILINDKITETSFDRSSSINVITDEGFEDINWNEFGL
jgi:dTDP-glucose pyrophosphorylase